MLPRDTTRLDLGPSRGSDTLPPFRTTAAPATNGTPAAAPPLPLPPRPAPLPPALAKPASVLGVVQALRRCWVFGLSVALSAGVVAGCVARALLPAAKYSAYTARATLNVNANAGFVASQPQQQTDFGTLKGTLQARAKSKPVLDKALARPEIAGLGLFADVPDRLEYLRNELVIDWNLGPEVLSIKLSGDRPKDLAEVVNAVADVLLDDVNNRERREKEEHLRKLEEIQKGYEKSLGPKRKELERLASEAGGEAPHRRTLKQMFATMALSARQGELLKVESDLRNAKAMLETPGARLIDPAPRPAPAAAAGFDEVMKSDPELQPLMAQIADLNRQIAHFSALYRDKPGMADKVVKEKGLQAQIDSLYVLGRQQYEKRLQAARGKAPAPAPADAGGAEELKARIAFFEASRGALTKEIDKLTDETRTIEKNSSEIDRIQQEIAVSNDVSKGVSTVLEKLRLEVAAPPRAAKLEDAAVPTVREERRLKFAGLTGVGVFAVALFGVGFFEHQRRRLYTARDVAQGLEVPVVGTQPLLPPALNPLDPAHAAAAGPAPWYGLPNDGLDATRALLLHGAAPGTPRVVTVTSAVGGEGASVLAVQLAASLARAGRRTLLIDANLRRPALHRAFGLPQGPGLAGVLRGEVAAHAAVRAAPMERLWVLPAGAADLRALQALSREATPALLDQLKKDYDCVVIDGAPVAACADALLLAQRSDAVVFSVLAGVSRVPTVHAGWQRLTTLGARLAGAVVQGADDGAPALNYDLRQPA